MYSSQERNLRKVNMNNDDVLDFSSKLFSALIFYFDTSTWKIHKVNEVQWPIIIKNGDNVLQSIRIFDKEKRILKVLITVMKI